MEEIEKVSWADLLIFQYPLYWYSVPAIIKGWADKVLVQGFAFDFNCGAVLENGLLKVSRKLLWGRWIFFFSDDDVQITFINLLTSISFFLTCVAPNFNFEIIKGYFIVWAEMTNIVTNKLFNVVYMYIQGNAEKF